MGKSRSGSSLLIPIEIATVEELQSRLRCESEDPALLNE